MIRRLPLIVQELLKLGLGFSAAVGAIAIFANWQSPHRMAVIAITLIGLIGFVLVEAVAAGLLWLLFGKVRSER